MNQARIGKVIFYKYIGKWDYLRRATISGFSGRAPHLKISSLRVRPGDSSSPNVIRE